MSSKAAIITELTRRQGADADGVFAARIGLSRGAWRLLKQDRVGLGRKAMQGISAAFPDLAPDILGFLMAGNDSKHAAPDSEDTVEAAS